MSAATVGIDLGTTSVKVCAVDASGSVVEEKTENHNAWIKTDSSEHREQDAEKIFKTVIGILSSMRTTLQSVHTVAITGQMHGVVIWNGESLAKGKLCCSPLITWMDSRVPQQFISSLPRWELGDVHSGYGMATLAWLSSKSLIEPGWNCCGTIMDMFGCYIARLRTSLMGIQNAFSWAYCNRKCQWTLTGDIIPSSLLPRIVPTGTVIGSVLSEHVALPLGARVVASLGDLQATVYPLLTANSAGNDVFPSPLLTEPFFDDCQLVTAASMNGGSAVHLLAEKIVEWASALLSYDTDHLQLDFGKFDSILRSSSSAVPSVSVQPTFYKERADHLPSVVRGLQPDTTVVEVSFMMLSWGVNIFRILIPYESKEKIFLHIFGLNVHVTVG
ncbi:Sedoheptulokinase [Toxocara canis]|uniref:Sedoheptulokinase n=1 Tax=Toxocara canis TaxID=6265 RepID=A0A0B2VKN8_TOXCA|nr:Sedoheptulokinase [Toxocara canis]